VETCRNGGSHEAAIAGLREDPVRDDWVRRGRRAPLAQSISEPSREELLS
jgi:hypothetical protein